MWVLIRSTTFVRNIIYSKKNWARYGQKSISIFMQSTRYSFQIDINLKLSR
jgi:hypothetical protein